MATTRKRWFLGRRIAILAAALPVAALALIPALGGRFATSASADEPEIAEIQFGTPSISAMIPASGPTSGGTIVTVYGVNLGWALSVTVGGSPAAFAVVNENTIQIATPPMSLGSYYVRVTTPGGITDPVAASLFTYTSSSPDLSYAITGMTPRYGPTSGGTVVMFTGSSLWNTNNVTVDNVNANWVQSGGVIYVTMPAHAKGLATVRFYPSAGGVVTSPWSFAYSNNGGAMDIFTLTPSYGPTAGGTFVTVTGFGFLNADAVLMDGIPAAFTIVSDNVIQLITPAHPAGISNIQVYDAGVSATAINVFTYTDFYNPGNPPIGVIRPTIVAITPDYGPAAGLDAVVLTGTGFSDTKSITVDGMRIGFIRINDSTLWLNMPQHIAGLVTVTIYNANGTTASIGFRYQDNHPAAPEPYDPNTGNPWFQ